MASRPIPITVGLDIIVNQVQGKIRIIRDADGDLVRSKVSVADRLEDDNFALDKKPLSDYYSREDIEGIVHDQVMFIIEHINRFNAGAENEAATGRALGKYVERFFLAQKILGLDIGKVRQLPESNPTRRLLEFSQEIVRNKGSPAEIVKILTRESRLNPPTPGNGLAELVLPRRENHSRHAQDGRSCSKRRGSW